MSDTDTILSRENLRQNQNAIKNWLLRGRNKYNVDNGRDIDSAGRVKEKTLHT